jgi:transposase
MGRLSMCKISEVLRQRLELKLSYRDIAASLGISISTIADYLSRAKAAGINWPLPAGLTEQELYDKLFLPVRVAYRKRQQPDWSYIHTELRKKGVTLQLLWREYREQCKDGLGYSQFCHLYADYNKSVSPTMRQIHKGGEKAFVDYAGMKVDWIEPSSGEIFQAEIFVGCLGASQYIFAEATRTQQLPDWLSSHIRMFEYFGGVPSILVPDNLRSGVTKAHRYDPDINANYQHFSEYYGVAIVPARSISPKDKAKVESGASIVERQILAPLRHVTFTSLGEINDAIKKGIERVNHQQFQKMDVTRRELFEELDKPALKKLPATRYEYASWKKVKINLDYHFVIDNCYYSVPYQYVGKRIEIRSTNNTIECFYENNRIAAHKRIHKKFGFSTLYEHMPQAHLEQAKFSAQRILGWAAKVGEHALEFVQHMMKSRAFPEQAYRSCLGLLRLGKRYGDARLNKACHKALLAGASKYQQVEAILKNNLEEVSADNTYVNKNTVVHENIRGPNFYK